MASAAHAVRAGLLAQRGVAAVEGHWKGAHGVSLAGRSLALASDRILYGCGRGHHHSRGPRCHDGVFIGRRSRTGGPSLLEMLPSPR